MVTKASILIMSDKSQRYVALLRGINVGKHHKVPMAELRETMDSMGFTQVKTLLNSGNIVFTGKAEGAEKLEKKLEKKFASTFGFSIPVIIRTAEEIRELIKEDPFQNVEIFAHTRLFVTFFREEIPWEKSDIQPTDGSYQTVRTFDRAICTVLDLSINNSPAVMDDLEKVKTSEITTRSWKTVLRIGKAL